tara:strand:+ start:25119 stop:25811 length:693 start_codon:yes stop_codon:yes gene_type:complete
MDNILIVVPARGGSKGIKLKNLKKIFGESLIKITSNVIHELPFKHTSIVSTDHNEIAREAERCNLEVPFIRPKSISGDLISDWDVLNHALLEMEKIKNRKFSTIIMLQPTSPLRSAKDVTECLDKFENNNFDAVWTVSPIDLKYHPKKILNAKNNKLSFYDNDGKGIIARQQLDECFIRNGLCYIISRNCILNHKNIYGKNLGYCITQKNIANIDTLSDLERATELMPKK